MHLVSFLVTRKRELVALLQLSSTVSFLWLFFTVPWVGLQYVIVVLPDHTHFFLQVYDIDNLI